MRTWHIVKNVITFTLLNMCHQFSDKLMSTTLIQAARVNCLHSILFLEKLKIKSLIY